MEVGFASNDDIRERIERSGHEFWSIGHAPNGLPIYCVRLGGEREPAILIVAGYHATEPAGVVGALQLLNELKSDHIVYVVPNCDPMGLEGYHRYLGFARGATVSFADNRGLATLLRRDGQVVYDDGDLVISLIGGFAFTAKDPSSDPRGPREVWRKLEQQLGKDAGLRAKLKAKRVVVPANLPGIEGCGLFERAYTVFVTEDGRMAHFIANLFGSPSPPPETQALQAIVDQVRPGLTLSLAEGQGSAFFLVTLPFGTDPLLEKIARAIVNEVRERGAELYTLAEMQRKIGQEDTGAAKDLGNGIFAWPRDPDSHCVYTTSRYGGYHFALETGRTASLERRGRVHVGGVLAGIRAFEASYR